MEEQVSIDVSQSHKTPMQLTNNKVAATEETDVKDDYDNDFIVDETPVKDDDGIEDFYGNS